MRTSNKGFIMADSIISLLIVCILATLSIMLYQNIKNYEEGSSQFREEENEEYKEIFNSYTCQRVCELADDSGDDDNSNNDPDTY